VRCKKAAFTLLEILIVVGAIGVLATMGVPRLLKRKPQEDWAHVVDEFNNIVAIARQEAILTHQPHRVSFVGRGKQRVFVEASSLDPEHPGKTQFKPLENPAYESEYALPEAVAMVGLYKNRVEQFAENKGVGACFIVPDGLVEECSVWLQRGAVGEEKKTFKMMPFFGTFGMSSGHGEKKR
jgi:prepilin-type N-terminal cleavage/methylation domain-containing protein